MDKTALQPVTAKWCDEMVAKGHKVYLQWDGGNDSGSVDFYVDDEPIYTYGNNTNKYNVDPNDIIDRCYEVLDYGGWAWDFSATGTAEWDPEEQAFIGEDRYAARNEYDEATTCDIKITVPEHLWFDQLALDLRTDPWDDGNTVQYIVKNGFLTEEHDDDQNRIERDELRPQLEEVLLQAREKNADAELEIEGTLGDVLVDRSMFYKEGDKLACNIKDIQLDTVRVTYKSIIVEFLKTETDEQV